MNNFAWFLKLVIRNIKALLFVNDKNIYRVFIKTSDVCNYQCTTCGNWKNTNNKWISLENINKLATKFKNQLFFLTLTGGEPFLKKDLLIEIISRLKKTNPDLRFISINTNCSLPIEIEKTITFLLQKFPDLKLFIGLHYIPSKEWGIRKTKSKDAYKKYIQTIGALNDLSKKHAGKINTYNILTIDQKEDFEEIQSVSPKNPWLNFANVGKFYKNEKFSDIGVLSNEEKITIINKFLELNKKNISYLSRRYLINLKNIIKRKERTRKCFAGINRIYVDEFGNNLLCFKGLKKRSEMNAVDCSNCWVSCEANFDLLANFFLPSFSNSHLKEIARNN